MNELLFVMSVMMSNGAVIDVPDGYKAVFVPEEVKHCITVEAVDLSEPRLIPSCDDPDALVISPGGGCE